MSPTRKVINLDEKGKKAEQQVPFKKSASQTDLKEQQDAAEPAIQADAQEIEPVRKQKYKKKEKKEAPEKPQEEAKPEAPKAPAEVKKEKEAIGAAKKDVLQKQQHVAEIKARLQGEIVKVAKLKAAQSNVQKKIEGENLGLEGWIKTINDRSLHGGVGCRYV